MGLFLLAAAAAQPAWAESRPAEGDDSLVVMQAFNDQAVAEQAAYELSDEGKHKILFFMGAALLLLIAATAWLGVSMGIYGKDVFAAHMVCAGLTVTLGIAHAVAAVVWFFPF